MDLTSDHPFWFVRNGLLQTYPPLGRDESCDVAVVGAGITGALIAHRLTQIGLAVVVVDGRDVCLGSTSASTALPQRECLLADQPRGDDHGTTCGRRHGL